MTTTPPRIRVRIAVSNRSDSATPAHTKGITASNKGHNRRDNSIRWPPINPCQILVQNAGTTNKAIAVGKSRSAVNRARAYCGQSQTNNAFYKSSKQKAAAYYCIGHYTKFHWQTVTINNGSGKPALTAMQPSFNEPARFGQIPVYSVSILIMARRLRAQISGVEPTASGRSFPYETVLIRAVSMPLASNTSRTAAARRSPSAKL